MAARDKYARQLKAQIDRLNGQAKKLEARAKKAQAAYAKQSREFRARRDKALAELKRLRGASKGAWRDVKRGAGSALRSMRKAFGRARQQFSKVK